ncbi:MAG: AmmeMemoRadiSam system protein B [Candidatus Bathyarchaeia archaeon]
MSIVKVRHASVAGSWYAGTETTLKRQLEEECFLHTLGPRVIPNLNPKGPRRIVGLLCPHAGYMYSGPVAAHSYGALAEDGTPRTVVVIGPNHTGMGSGVSIMLEGLWRTPLGETAIDSEIAGRIQKASSYIDIDEKAHAYEHSIELQLPFLQYILQSRFNFVPICMLLQDLDVAVDVGRAIASALLGVDAVIIASSDMTHYERQTSAEKKDHAAIDAMSRLNVDELYRVVNSLNISMCGVGPVAAMITASKLLAAEKAVLLKYATSGDVTGDKSAVVGYCAMAFSKC